MRNKARLKFILMVLIGYFGMGFEGVHADNNTVTNTNHQQITTVTTNVSNTNTITTTTTITTTITTTTEASNQVKEPGASANPPSKDNTIISSTPGFTNNEANSQSESQPPVVEAPNNEAVNNYTPPMAPAVPDTDETQPDDQSGSTKPEPDPDELGSVVIDEIAETFKEPTPDFKPLVIKPKDGQAASLKKTANEEAGIVDLARPVTDQLPDVVSDDDINSGAVPVEQLQLARPVRAGVVLPAKHFLSVKDLCRQVITKKASVTHVSSKKGPDLWKELKLGLFLDLMLGVGIVTGGLMVIKLAFGVYF